MPPWLTNPYLSSFKYRLRMPTETTTHHCQRCGHQWTVTSHYESSEYSPANQSSFFSSNCEKCFYSDEFGKLEPAEVAKLDNHIFANEILQGIQFLKTSLSVGLHEALLIFHLRYSTLRKTTPEAFLLSEEAYWNGFYS
jgi:hypothetical protein